MHKNQKFFAKKIDVWVEAEGLPVSFLFFRDSVILDMQNKTFKKKYLAVVDGKFENKKGSLEDYLYKDERNNISKVVNKDKKNAKLAKLDYEVLNYDDKRDLSLVKIDLHTRKTSSN